MDHVLDSKVCKKSYPRTNNEDVLEFVFGKIRIFLCAKTKSSFEVKSKSTQNSSVENGFAAKLFSMMTVEVDSQAVTINTNRYFFLLYSYKLCSDTNSS